MVKIFQMLAAGSALTAILGVAQADVEDPHSYTLQWENDIGFSDRWYTNGMRATKSQLTKDSNKAHDKFLSFLADRWCDNKGGCTVRGQALGQNFYTPGDITVAGPQPDDRPWAGWLYYGVTAQKVIDHGSMESLEIDLGIVGPAAGGKFVQKTWHELVGAREPRGWGNQLRNEPGVMVTWVKRVRLFASQSIDFTGHHGWNAGNVMTALAIGGTLRMGKGLCGYGTPPIPSTVLLGADPSPALLDKNASDERCAPGNRRSEWYGFLYGELRLVAHNIFLDGNTFRDSHSVDKKHAVADYGFGVSVLRRNNRRVTFMRINRTPEFTAPSGTKKLQQYSGIAFTQEFD
jgi:lipid A 3-O-deacylase